MVVVDSGPAARESRTGHILLLHDYPAALDEVSATLRDGGFRVSATDSRAEALGLSVARRPHLILIGLTRAADVADVCRRFRSLTDAPLYILAERIQPPGMIAPPAGIPGAHLIPPRDRADLLSTLDAALRRMRAPRLPHGEDLLSIGDLEISLSSQTVVRQGRPLDLSPIEFRLLAVLRRRFDQAVSSHQLLTEVWGPDYAEDVQNLRIFIRYLRAKIEDDPNEPRYLLTESSTGYRLTNPHSSRT